MKLSRLEIAILALALVVLAVFRWFSVYSHKWNSDEPQHLHVVWAWTVGKLQYRDVFDNHTPLFHILCAPLFRWLGERADIVQPMRMAMIPLFAASIWCVYRLAANLFDRRTGWFAAILAALLPVFYFRMGEFRTDVMWTTVWLLTLVVALTGRMTPGRIFAAALLLGAAFSVSMKTTYLVFFLAIAGAITWLLAGRPISKSLPAYILALLGGVLVVPGAIVAYFASQGALKPLYHCVIEHNTASGEKHNLLHHLFSESTLWLIPAWFCTAAMLPSVRQDPARGYRRLFLFLVTALFYSLLRIFWPVVTTQDYLPWLPLLPIFAVPGCSWVRDWLQKKSSARISWLLVLCPIAAAIFVWRVTPNDSPADAAVMKRLTLLAVLLPIYLVGVFFWFRERRQSPLTACVPWLLLPSLLLAGEIAYIVTDEPLSARPEQRRIGHLAQLLRLIDPGEYVLDTKGETIFRPRPTYLVLETLTMQQIQSGRIKDDIVECLIKTRTALVHSSARMTDKTKDFIDKNYVHVDGGRVLGKRLATPKNVPVSFEIIIPERYEFVTPYGPASGTLDGQPIDGPRWLEAGRHEIVSADAAGQIVLVWARALERGFSPYIDSDAKANDP
jgi:4-amino-4-deoxy-L-arabinose transferase-like glycosyltransferase